jgi:TolB protein
MEWRIFMGSLGERRWFHILFALATLIAMGAGLSNGEQNTWKIELASFSGQIERVAGDWVRLDNGLFRQNDATAAPTILLFGRDEWADYRLRIRARIMKGTGGLFVFFRYRDEDRRLWWSISVQEGIPSGVGENRWGHGRIIPETGIPHPIDKERWYEISLHVSGTEVTGYIDGDVRMEFTLPDDGIHTAGKLGLGTWNTVAEFEFLELEQVEAEVLPSPPSLRGRVLVRGMVDIPIPGTEITGPFGTITADQHGQFFVRELIPGRTMLTISAPGFVRQRVVFNLEEGENLKVFYLRPHIRIGGGKILFFREYERDEGIPRGDIFVLLLESGVERKVTQQPGAYFSPQWSPDGLTIAFYTLDSREIFLVPAEGGESQKIAPGVSPRWSPDSQRLLYVDDATLWSWRSDDGDPILLFESPAYLKDYSWSPEGNRVTFESQSRIYIASGDGGGVREVAYPGQNPVWSPDGRTILFISPVRGLMKIDIEAGAEITLAPRARFEDPRWSPTGDIISYRKWDKDDGGVKRPVLYLMKADGGKRYRTFHAIKEGIEEYRWSPRGGELVFLTRRDPFLPNTIYRLEVEEKKIEPILDFPATHLLWSPDGEWISFLSKGDAGWDIYVIKRDGTGLKKVTDTPETEFQEGWDPSIR